MNSLTPPDAVPLGDRPAFPPVERFDGKTGMTFRQHAAIEAMKGFLANPAFTEGVAQQLQAAGILDDDLPPNIRKAIAFASVRMADALIVELIKE